MKKKRKGHFCRGCGWNLPNEKFSGKGHRDHLCKQCTTERKRRRKEYGPDWNFGTNPFEGARDGKYFRNLILDQNWPSLRKSPGQERLFALSNTTVPAIQSLIDLGFEVRRVIQGESERWYALSPENAFVADDPLSLLGLVAMRSLRGTDWKPDDQTTAKTLECFGLDSPPPPEHEPAEPLDWGDERMCEEYFGPDGWDPETGTSVD